MTTHTPIQAMSFSRKDAILKVSSLGHTLRAHLIKLYLTGGQTQNFSGWRREVINYLVSSNLLSKIKGGKRLTREDLKDSLLEFPESSMFSYLTNLMEDYLPRQIKTASDYRYVAQLVLEDISRLEPSLLNYLESDGTAALSSLLTEDLFKRSKTFLYLSSL